MSKNNFIIASPRSGTTWMSKMLNAHKNVFCVERRLFGNYADLVLDEGESNPRLRVTLDKYVKSLLLHHGISYTQEKRLTQSILKTIIKEEKKISKKKILVDKITPYLNTSDTVIQQINSHFPKSKIVYLVRDGRDVLTSGVFHWFNKQANNSTLSDFEVERRKVFLENENSTLKRFFQDKEIEQWANEWLQPLKTIKKAKENHDVKVVFYEAMLANPRKVVESVFEFLSIKISAAKLDKCIEAGSFNKMSQGRNRGEAKQDAHVRKGVSGDWKNYFTLEDCLLFNKIAGDYLVEFGYEENTKWIERFR